MGDSEINFDEKIIPHRLEGVDREDWLDELWRIFTELSTAGTITMQMLQTVVDELNIEGDDAFLERHVPKEKWSKITYQEFVQYLDDRSRAAAEDFVETSSQVDEGVITSENGESAESVGRFASVTKRITDCWGGIEITPKVTLVAATAALMILVSVALIVGLAVVWNTTALKAEEETVRLMHIAAEKLIEDLEHEVFEDKALGLIQEATMISVWLGEFYKHYLVEKMSLIEDRILRMSLAMIQKVEITYGRSNDIVYWKEADVLAGYLENASLGNTLDLLTLSSVKANMFPGFAIVVDCTKGTPIKFSGGNVCIAYNDTAVNDELIRSATSDVNDLNAEAVRDGRETLGYLAPLYHTTVETELDVVETSQPRNEAFYLVNESVIPRGMCVLEEMQPLCDTFLKSISRNSSVDRTYSWPNITFFKNSSMFGAGYSLKQDVFILSLVAFADKELEQFQNEVIDMVNKYNDARDATQDEIALSIINNDNQITFPVTSFKAGTTCKTKPCEWPSIARQAVDLSFSSGQTGWEILPDYKPEASIAAYHRAIDVKLGLLVHVNVADVRSRMATRLATAIDELNVDNEAQTKIHIYQLANIPNTRVYETRDQCPADTYCLPPRNASNPTNKAYLAPYFRFDCIHCQPISRPFSEYGAVVSKTAGGEVFLSETEDIARFRKTGADKVKVDGLPYLRSYSFMNNFSSTLVTLEREDEALKKDKQYLGIAVGCSVAFLVIGIIVLCYLFFSSFDLIEKDWAAYKNRIERERTRFSHLVKGLLPPHIADRLVGGNKILIDQISGSAFLFIDLCGFTNESKNWQPKHLGRYVTYCFAVMEEVAQHHGIIKVRTIGDLFCGVALRDNEKSKDDSTQHPTCRAMDTAGMLMTLFSTNYEHMPQHSKYFKDVFKDRLHDGRSTVMPALRIGIHSASVVGGAYSIGNASHYDFYGPGPAVANRLQQTASPGRIHVSHVIRDSIRQWGKRNVYTFDQQRKTIVRGQGTISSYFVKTMLLEIPTSITEPLGMRRATKRVDFSLKSANKDNSSFDASNNSQEYSS